MAKTKISQLHLIRASFAGDLLTISWLAMALGGICGSLLGGFALTNLQIDTIFLLFSILPAIQLLSCGLVEDNSVDSNNSRGSQVVNGNSIQDEDNSLGKKSDIGNLRRKKSRKKSQKNSKQKAVVPSESKIPEIVDSLALRLFHSLKAAASSLCHAFKQPIILRPMTWFFLAHVTVPNLLTVMFYYQTESLNLDASFLGTVRVVGWFSLMLGTFIYNRYLKTMKLRRILICCSHVSNECCLWNIR
ncbi:probable folate-biopterin transporter 4 [Quercus suber]|uniref:probable folate-biopterin transporter 4 n=1 Tax=Quercus suber TaxID=58331 RepID=UPI0032DEAB31